MIIICIIKHNKNIRNLLVWEGVDIFPIIEARLEYLAKRHSVACVKAYDKAEEIIKARGIEVLLVASLSSCTSRAVAKAAHNTNVPVVSWQHGNYGYMEQPIFIYNDIIDTDFVIVYGDEVIKTYAKEAKKYHTKLLSVGSATLEALRLSKQHTPANNNLFPLDKPVVLYVQTSLYENCNYISLYEPFSDNHYWRINRAVLDILAKHYDKATMVVKLHPSLDRRNYLSTKYAKERELQGFYFISNECGFKDLLPYAELVIIDFPSTVLLESLVFDMPIILLDKYVRINNDFSNTLPLRVTICHEPDDFIEKLETLDWNNI